MKMFEIKSLIKANNEFIEIDQFSGELDDSEYIEGALMLTYNYAPLIGLAEADLIDQLWAYILDGIGCILDGKAFSTCFPDQPIELNFTPSGSDQFEFEIMVNKSKKTKFDIREFSEPMLKEAEKFFSRLNLLVDGDVYSHELTEITRLNKVLHN